MSTLPEYPCSLGPEQNLGNFRSPSHENFPLRFCRGEHAHQILADAIHRKNDIRNPTSFKRKSTEDERLLYIEAKAENQLNEA